MRKRSEIGKAVAPPPAAPTLMAGQVACAKCGLVQPGGTSDCLACGETLPEMILNAGKPTSKEPRPEENLGKLAYDLKNKDLDITLAQLSAIVPMDRRELQKWVDSKSADVPPAVRMILERLKGVTPKPLIASKNPDVFENDKQSNVDVFENYKPPFVTNGNGEEVTYVLGKEMYRVAEFATFDVGPYSATTRIREDETRVDAMNRLRVELETVAEIDRVARRDSYIRTMLGIKPALKKASDSIKE